MPILRADLQELINEQNYNARLTRSESQLLTLMENLRSELEPEMSGWVATGSNAAFERDLPPNDLHTLVRRSRQVYYREPHGRVVMRDLVKFVIGGGTVIDFAESDDDTLKAMTKWWRKFCRVNKWVRRQREIVTRAFRDGNVFIRRYDQPGEEDPPLIRFIEPEQLDDTAEHPYGIEYDPQDGETAVAYHIRWRKTNQVERVPAEQMLHIKMDVDENMAMGRPIIESVLNYLGKYGKWLDARMALNIVRANVALVKQVAGSPQDLSRLRQNQNATRNQSRETDKTKMLRPGTIISGTPGVEYKMLSPNLDARDAAEDGATLLRGVAAGAGFPDVFVTANYQNSNYASTVVSQNTGIREFEDWSAVFGEYLSTIVEWVIEDGISKQQIPSDADTDHEVTFPPLIRRDITQENTAYQSMYAFGVISKRSWALKMGFDPDAEQRIIEEEGGPPPLPQSGGFGGGGFETPPPGGAVNGKDPANRRPRQNVNANA